MAAHTEDIHLPAHFPRWLYAPAIGVLFVATIRVLRYRARRPSVTRMSEEWLRNHEREAGQDGDQ